MLALAIYLAIYSNNNDLADGRKTIVIDAGHGGDSGKLYSYYGEEFNGSQGKLIKVDNNLTNDKIFYALNKEDFLDKKKWLHFGDSGANFIFNNISYMEKEINLGISVKLDEELGGDFNINLTRWDDRYIFLERRREIALQNNADLFISIHQNSALGNCSDLNNAEIYYNDNDLEQLSNSLLGNLSNGLKLKDGFVKKNREFAVLKTDIEAVLIEVNFLCNEKNAKFLTDGDNQWEIAEIISDVIRDYYSNR